ncbi:MAG: DUF1194 domain-containing protein [Hyphomicrobiaceae bacterium]
MLRALLTGLRWRAWFGWALALLPTLMLALPAPAQAEDVDLRLVLAVDASGSVNESRFELQKQGYVAAFRHPRVLRAIKSGALGKIAVTMTQWTGPGMQVQVVPWSVISNEHDAEAFSAAIEAAPRKLFAGGTSISGAIDHGVKVLGESPHIAARSVIDVSGDGGNNRGRPAASARDEAVAAGVVINGLPILELDPTLDQHYLNNVIGGPNSFMVPAQRFTEFSDAVLKKLIIEIAGLPGSRIRVTKSASRACLTC